MEIKELTTLEEMTSQLELICQLYPKMTLQKYESFLKEMIPHKYTQIAVFDNDKCIGITGCWFSTKLWSGKYLEIDNFVVDEAHRSQGIGKMLLDFVEQKALGLGCTNIVLDAFTTNFKAHRFYYNQGYAPKGFHFVKILVKEWLT
ncbi:MULTISPECIES: GNAT family N-acetyltransferase [Flavobacterium]|uniref:GNAT family N-acetyltransferase n=1 Tax=Flavobacterium TaxID=237 RepID=UPI001FCB8251|nr:MULTISPECIES: GNAT family N-acetyltransferase [Flavobacterium]UOK43195.1 GNAT family N-acetyltransferase [Flavobacterium enshiense]